MSKPRFRDTTFLSRGLGIFNSKWKEGTCMETIYNLSDIDWFEWNGVKCTEYGMHVLKQPSFIRASERTNSVTIPGRAGSLTLLEGEDIYDDIDMVCTCIIDDPYKTVGDTKINQIEKICGWLRGYGKVKFAFDTDGYYEARVTNQISFEKIVAGNPHRSFQVQFQCKPFKRLDSGDTILTATESPFALSNKGNVPSKPILKVYGTSEGTIMCGNDTMIINNFSDASYIVLECEAKKAYTGAVGSTTDPLKLLGTRVTGDWLKIPTGNPRLTFTGGITKIEITPRWRCLG